MARAARGGGTTAGIADPVEPVGTVRRSQLVSTYGIGAIVDLEKGSFMPMGLEDWEIATRLPSLSISEPTLETMLNVSHLRLGPVVKAVQGARTVSARTTIPAVRFPEWHECPKCHRIGTEGAPFELAPDGSRLLCLAHAGATVHTTPVRFVVACRRGHVSDFPWVWWAHRAREEGSCENPSLYLRSHGRSASLADLYVVCNSCRTGERQTSQSLGGAFGGEALRGHACGGVRPWLRDREEGCQAVPQALQRGASNVHFPVVCSALSIPPASEAAMQIVQELRYMLDPVPASAIADVLGGVAAQYGIAAEPLIVAWRNLKELESGRRGQLTERIARAEEYAALSEDRDDPVIAGVVPQFQNTVSQPPPALARWFDLVGAVTRLREVRAIAGFSRIEPHPVAAEDVAAAIVQGDVAPLSKAPRNWLPAAEIRGEGVFLRFDATTIEAWLDANPGVAARAAEIDAVAAAAAARRGHARDHVVTPRLLLVHSFAHALIRQISIECGYSASALRERLYVTEPDDGVPATNGVLVYTGSPDSEGSLGGLVRLATPEMLGPIVLRTLAAARWCGSDPVCIETEPAQAGERLSGAACHSCLLLPETACERFNRELDRAVLVGDTDGEFQGFFADAEASPWPS
ncbi:DUF1998 domain-containing protein [Methylobacterium sp. Leaf117]|uniref:DUF1998 domain-containing protein n=1 Tax=Methylobacterium sp. Leaf117 TaxID=1736260 RepID=UPI0006FA2F1A|nr:DUF1998 domain-containing protein [Methylobacterium sp. Leaf117]KQP91927.1 hypothetical protein ASF57_05450 [Methylobacterium sp. Leaf117]